MESQRVFKDAFESRARSVRIVFDSDCRTVAIWICIVGNDDRKVSIIVNCQILLFSEKMQYFFQIVFFFSQVTSRSEERQREIHLQVFLLVCAEFPQMITSL